MELAVDILDNARWFYIPYRPYKTFYYLIVQNTDEVWAFYYLDNISSAGQIVDVSGLGDLNNLLENPKKREPKESKQHFYREPIPEECVGVRPDDLFRKMEAKTSVVDRDISGCAVVRQVHGNLGAIIREFQKVLK